jgi:diguanylate cyclase (GGDEF)-like protein
LSPASAQSKSARQGGEFTVPLLQELVSAAKQIGQRLSGSLVLDDIIAEIFVDNFDGLVLVDADGRVIAASQVAEQMLLGEQGGTLAGRDADEVLPQPILWTIKRLFDSKAIAQPSDIALASWRAPGREERVLQYVVTVSVVGRRKHLVACLTFWDVTERRRREEELAYLGTHDPLTGLLSRSELMKIIDTTLSNERARAGGLSMLLLDLGRFRSINDTLGHSNGDKLLKQVASRLKAAGLDIVARLGGDVFATIRNGRYDEEEMADLCESLIQRVTLPYSLGHHRALVGCAIGLTHTDVSGFEPETLVSHADLALSEAKTLPGNSFVRFTRAMDQRLKEKQDMDAALRVAIEKQQFTLTYQPQVVLESGALAGVEALVRWIHPELGSVPPDRFIPAAEESGQIVELGRFVLQTACREVANWPVETRLSVNVSPMQFELVDVVDEIRVALTLSGLPPERLEIEITEGIFVDHGRAVSHALDKLRSMGVSVALDDFGTGYSSLSYLGRLPVDTIKIDQSFVRSLPADQEASAIIRAVMTLSETLGKIVIAEGIETADQAWMLRMMGCKIGQGYYFGRPRAGDEMAEWLLERRNDRFMAAG